MGSLRDLKDRIVRKKRPLPYVYSSRSDQLGFEEGVEIIRHRYPGRVSLGAIDTTDPGCTAAIRASLKEAGIALTPLTIEREEYLAFLSAAGYRERYPLYYPDNFFEKTLEHYLCYLLLDLREGDTFIDIASEHSPVPEIFGRISGCTCFSQDLMYEPGIHGRRIGGDASDLPVPDQSFDAAIATCSLEHFENDSDIRFMTEMERVLAPGGKIIIAPLYLYTLEACQTDPLYSIPGEVNFDDDARIFCAKGWGNRHARFYSPASLSRRIIAPHPHLEFRTLLLENPGDVDPTVYCRFVLEGTRV